MGTSYRELDYQSGKAIQTLRGRIGLTQAGLAEYLGVSVRTVREWEAGGSYLKAERFKVLIALAIQYRAFPKGSEAEEIRMLWKITRQKRLLDEDWLSALLQGQAHMPCDALAPVPEIPNHMSAPIPPEAETKGKSDDGPAVPLSHEHEDAKVSQAARRHRRRLVGIVIILAILSIIGMAETFFLLQARGITLTPHTYPIYLPGNGKLVFFDPLSQKDGSRWDSYSISEHGGLCQFTGGTYLVTKQKTSYFNWCPANGTFGNFAFEVQLSIIQGDCGGMTFRDGDNEGFYYFQICENSTYQIIKYLDYSGFGSTLLRSGQSLAIHTGLNQQNKIAVVASGSSMTFYVNGQQLTQVQDNSYTSGHIALTASSYLSAGYATVVMYSNAALWTL